MATGGQVPTDPNKQLLRELGFECYEQVGSGANGIVFKGVCNSAAKKLYLIDENEAKRQIRAGVPVRTEPKAEGTQYYVEKSLAGKPCAIKLLSQRSTPFIYDEMLVSVSLSHSNCVQIYGTATDLDNSLYYLISEYLNGKELDTFLDDFDGQVRAIDEPLAIEMLVQLVCGLEYLHRNGITHGDMHSGNIMYNISPATGYQWKYLDFGLSTMSRSPTRRGLVGDIVDLGLIFKQIINSSAIRSEKKTKLNQLTDSMVNSSMADMTQVRVQLKNSIQSSGFRLPFSLPFLKK